MRRLPRWQTVQLAAPASSLAATTQLGLAKALAVVGKPIAAVALRNPYDLFPLPENVYTLVAYEYTARSTAAVADVLRGHSAAPGRLPIAHPDFANKEAQ